MSAVNSLDGPEAVDLGPGGFRVDHGHQGFFSLPDAEKAPPRGFGADALHPRSRPARDEFQQRFGEIVFLGHGFSIEILSHMRPGAANGPRIFFVTFLPKTGIPFIMKAKRKKGSAHARR